MKISLGVFFGGQSVEHEVSIISALQAIENIDREKYDIVPVYITKDNRMFTSELLMDIKNYKNINHLLQQCTQVILAKNNSKVDLIPYPVKIFGKKYIASIDIALPVVHGTNVEDGALQGFFKTLGLPFALCDVTSSAIGMDKPVTKAVLKANSIPVLDCIEINKKEYYRNKQELEKRVTDSIGYPVIVKPSNLGSSVGIKIAKDEIAFYDAMEYAFNYAPEVLIEKAITNLKEVNCSVLGDYEEAKASVCEEPIGSQEILSYEDKYMSGGSKGGSKGGGKSSGMASLSRKIPAEIDSETTKEIEKLAVATFKALKCNGVVRIDFMIDLDTNKVYVNEINTIPGSLSFYLWEKSGISYKELLEKIIDLALKRQREMAQVSYAFDTNILQNANLGGTKGK